ncbi:MAG: hypothetical protein ABJB97_06695, partial [Acidobacteriota bacterium]
PGSHQNRGGTQKGQTMAEERTLGIARAPERSEDDFSKEELQLRMEEARDSISQTVTEIKDSVTQQYETVKDALDWREHFKKSPVAWSLGAVGVGFFVGYGIAAVIKDDEPSGSVASSTRAYARRPIIGEPLASALAPSKTAATNGEDENDDGPGLISRFKETRAFDRLQQEVGSLGDRLVEELSTTAQTVILPALLRKVKELIGADLSSKTSNKTESNSASASVGTSSRSSYSPSLERNPS